MKTQIRTLSKFSALCCFTLAIALVAIPGVRSAHATNTSWTLTSGTASWSTTADWTNSYVPSSSSDNAIYTGGATVGTVVDTNDAVGSIMNNSSTTHTWSILKSSTYTLTVGSATTIANIYTTGASNTLTITAPVVTTGTTQFVVDSSNVMNIDTSGTLTGTGPVFATAKLAGNQLQFGIVNTTGAFTTGTFSTFTIGATTDTAYSGVGKVIVSSFGANVTNINVDYGTLRIGTGNAFNSNNILTIAAGAFLDINNQNQTFGDNSGYIAPTNNGDIVGLNGPGGTLTLNFNGNYNPGTLGNTSSLADNFALVKSGTGTVTLSSSSDAYIGGTKINAGTLSYATISGSTASGETIAGPMGSGTVTFAGNSTLQAGVSGTIANLVVFNTSVTGTLDTQSYSTTLSGALSGTGGMAKIGSGTLILNAANSYSGATMVNNGTLQANATNALSTTNGISVNSGGTLNVSANNALGTSSSPVVTVNTGGTLLLNVNNAANSNNSVTLSGGTLANGSSGLTQSLGTLTMSSSSTINLDDNGTTHGSLAFSSISGLSSTNKLDIANWGTAGVWGTTNTQSYLVVPNTIDITNSGGVNYANNIYFQNGAGTLYQAEALPGTVGGTYDLVAVPEPGTVVAGLALLGFVCVRERRRILKMLET